MTDAAIAGRWQFAFTIMDPRVFRHSAFAIWH